MSPLWPERLSVLVGPDRLVATHRPRGPRARAVTAAIVPVPAAAEGTPLWEPAAAELATLLAASPQWRGAALRLILSDAFVRYALVPWNDHLSHEPEHLLFARHQFASTYGPIAKQWAVRLSLDRAGESHVACAVDQPCLDRLTAIARDSRLTCVSLQPLLMAAFNRWRGQLREPIQWLVIVEGAMLCGALLSRDRWLALRRWHSQGDWISELPLWLSRERLINEAAAADAVFLVAPRPPERGASTVGPTLRFLGATSAVGRGTGAPGSGAFAAEEAGHLACIL